MTGGDQDGTCLLVAPSSSALAALPRAGRTRSVAELRSVVDSVDAGGDVRAVVVGPDVDVAAVVDLALHYRVARPELGVLLERRHITRDDRARVLEAGVREVLAVGDLGGLVAAVAHAAGGAAPHRDDAPRPAEARPAGSRPADRQRRGRVTTVFSGKGGAGKTTLCTNLAAALADGGRRDVVLVDLDLALGDVAIAMDLFPSRSLVDAVPLGTAGVGFEQLGELLTPHSPGLFTLLAPVGTGSTVTVPPSLVQHVLDLLAEHADHVVVDTAPTLDAVALAALDRSDTVVLLATLETPSLKHLMSALDRLQASDGTDARVKVLLNRCDSEVGVTVQEVERTLGRAMDGFIPSSRDVPTSVNQGVPLVLLAPHHPVSLAVARFAEREIVHRSVPAVVDLRQEGEVRGSPHRARRPASH